VVLQVFGLLINQCRGDRAVGSGGFCLSPVIIACLCNIFMQTFYVLYFYISVCI
jgi:hypothetical protein